MLRSFDLVPSTIFPVSGIINCFIENIRAVATQDLRNHGNDFFSPLCGSFGRIVKSRQAVTIQFDKVSDKTFR
jgi:hypothetical protein